jgi:hypothetical protein
MRTKIVLDNKRRGSFGSEFEPGDSFEREVRGETVMFHKLRPAEAPLVKARKIKGRWVGAAVKLDRDEIVASIREDREGR